MIIMMIIIIIITIIIIIIPSEARIMVMREIPHCCQ